MQRVALYCRVSTEEQVLNGESLKTQEDALKQYAIKNNYEIVDSYIDKGFSGTNLKRPNLQRLLEDVKDNKIDLVLITKLDRWGRGVGNYYKVNDILEKHNVNWKTIFEDYDTSTTTGKLMVNIMLAIAENEARVTIDRIKVVFKNKAENKQVIGRLPFGYKTVDKRAVIDEEAAEIVRFAFKTFLQTTSLGKTVLMLRDKKRITYQGLKVWFKSFFYIGKYVSKTNGIVINEYCPRIIDDETFLKVNEMLRKNTSFSLGKPVSTYLFTSLVKCKKCNNSYNGYFKKLQSKSGQKKLSYRCYSAKIHNCDNVNISENEIEKQLINIIKNSITPITNKDIIDIKQKKKLETKIDVEKIKRQMQKLTQMVLDDKIRYEIYIAEYKRLDEQLKQAEEIKHEEVKRISVKESDELRKRLVESIDTQYYNFSQEQKRSFWKRLIDVIYINEDKTITVNFIKEMGI